jgi:protein TonB
MRQAGIEGEVTVDFIVTTEGNVAKAFAVRSSRHEFEAAAVAAVSKWKFAPGTKAGRPVNTHMQVPIAFALN